MKKGKEKALVVRGTPEPQSTAGLMQLALREKAGIDQLQKLVEMKYRDEELNYA